MAYANLGCVYQKLGDFGKAIEYHPQSLPIVWKLGDRAGESRAYWHLGAATRTLKD
jgi:tetratricopeptide (TPR) repeat protein